MRRSKATGDPCVCGETSTWHPECYGRIADGYKAKDSHGVATIDAVICGQRYVVLHRPRCPPFVVSMRDYFKLWRPA
jgi:hypothetical protein